MSIAILETCKASLDSQPNAARPEPSNIVTHYVIVRGDLPRGFLAAQVVHAAGESSPGDLSPGTYAVVLATDSEGLHQLEARLEGAGVPYRSIRESDPPYAGELTAIGITPAPRKEVQRYVSSLPLLR